MLVASQSMEQNLRTVILLTLLLPAGSALQLTCYSDEEPEVTLKHSISPSSLRITLLSSIWRMTLSYMATDAPNRSWKSTVTSLVLAWLVD
jgi:hypothetical protein